MTPPTPRAAAGPLVGIDIGGTKTRLVAEGDISLDVTVSSDSWRGPLGFPEADAAGIEALLAARLGRDVRPASLVIGAHGYDTTADCADLERRLAQVARQVTVVNDSELMVPAMGVTDGIGLVVGTGAIATARSDDGELLAAGGWGWLLGDEGSAPALVREAVRAVLAHLDTGAAPDRLCIRLLESFAARDAVDLAVVATRMASPDGWGSRAVEVFAAADEGSVLAGRVIEAAGKRLADLVGTLLRRGVRAAVVVAGGAVIEHQPRLAAAVSASLLRLDPSVSLLVLDRPPVAGALDLARQRAASA